MAVIPHKHTTTTTATAARKKRQRTQIEPKEKREQNVGMHGLNVAAMRRFNFTGFDDVDDLEGGGVVASGQFHH